MGNTRTMSQSNTRFLKACRGEKVDKVPVWMMRQAGRYQPEYRALKEKMGGFWGLSTNADAIAEATLFAQKSLNTDAAIIFSDITVPAWAMGLDLEFVPGPKFSTPVQDMAAINALNTYDPHTKCDFLMDGIRQTREGLPDSCSLIGFVGAPLTVAGYMIEGYPSKGWVELKRRVYGEPEFMHAMLEKVSDALIAHARAQVEAGCDTIQIFDTTAGELNDNALSEYAFHYGKKVIDGVKDMGVPIIYFARGIAAHLGEAAKLGADVLGVDWSISMAEARKIVGPDITIMGNLDPTILFCSGDEVEKRTKIILEDVGHEPGFIFNLGHGILVNTPVENAERLVKTVHAFDV